MAAHRFTNAYRVADRVTQYLIAEVQGGTDRSQDPREIFFRTLLFKIFNKIETWELIERAVGPIESLSCDWDKISTALEDTRRAGQRIYSAAYIMPSPNLGFASKHANHLALVRQLLERGVVSDVMGANSLRGVYNVLLSQPSFGPFLAFQYAIDLNYSGLVDFDENDFVVAGPGAIDGLSKCFLGGTASPEDLLAEVQESQEREFARRGISFPYLSGRRLQLIDCQNLFCEISKYSRVAYPGLAGSAGRLRIKQKYRANSRPLPPLTLPAKWARNGEAGR